MPLIVNNFVVIGQNTENTPVVNEVPKVKAEPASPVSADSKNHVLIINGKEKKLTKHSAYLLDMLTLDD